MIYTTVTVSSNLSVFQKDFLIKSGFAIFGIVFSRSVKSNELHIIIGQLASKNIPFSLQSQPPQYNSRPCVGCKQ